MRTMKLNAYFKKITLLAAAVVMAVMTACFVLGCTLFRFGELSVAEFDRKELELSVGDTYDLSTLISDNNVSYKLSSSNTSVAELDGTVLTAKKRGITKVTAKTDDYSSMLTVVVSDCDSLDIAYSGNLVQTVGNTKEIVFTPVTTGSVSNAELEWRVNGADETLLPADRDFKFTPSAAGEYVITARADGLEATQTVRAFYPGLAAFSYSGDTDQSEPFSAVEFTVNFAENPANPQNYIQWFVNGEEKKAGADKTFTFNPTPGKFDVSVVANGVSARINGQQSVTLLCRGSIVPDAPVITFDNVYPHVYVEYDAVGMAEVEISGVGLAKVYSSADPEYSSRFSDGRFDASGLIDLFNSASRRTYGFRVRSLGDDLFTESDYSEKTSLTQLPKAAEEYLEKKYLDKDYYITSETEYTDLLEYTCYFRDKSVKRPYVSFKCYLAIPKMPATDETALDLWSRSFSVALTSGNYTNIQVSAEKNVMTTSYNLDTVNNPDRQTYSSYGDDEYTAQLHAILPHINYDENKYRPKDYVFPIDRAEKTQSVTYTDELYLAVQSGVKPIPARGSSAEAVYKAARDVLSKIITEDMTDVEKAHAIYDWIMWQVTYDTPATKADNGEHYSAYYLEGVFGDFETKFGNKTYAPYAVCDGMSKAYSLMCNIEGVPCVRVVGEAKADGDTSAAGHAWNKVYVNGGWYVVDCTWGDMVVMLSIDKKYNSYELGYHGYLFQNDVESEAGHFEPYLSENAVVYAPETAREPFSVYENMTYNGVKINCRIKSYEDQAKRIEEIVTAFATSYKKLDTISVPGCSVNPSDIDYQALDFKFDGKITLTDDEIDSIVKNAVKKVRRTSEIKVFILDDTVVIMIRN